MKRDLYPLLIPLALISLLLVSCHSSRNAGQTQIKGIPLANDPYIGTWDFIVRNTPSGNAEGVISIEREGMLYRAIVDSGLGKMALDHVSIEDERLKGHFRYKGFKVNVKGIFDENTLEGKLAVSLASFPLEATRRNP